jgi:hypothetical protein
VVWFLYEFATIISWPSNQGKDLRLVAFVGESEIIRPFISTHCPGNPTMEVAVTLLHCETDLVLQ